MKVDEYDEDGVARMLVDVLTRTLGITESRLADVLKYLSYDGVYAEKEERVALSRSGHLLHRC